jgi:hypothetical protein
MLQQTPVLTAQIPESNEQLNRKKDRQNRNMELSDINWQDVSLLGKITKAT